MSIDSGDEGTVSVSTDDLTWIQRREVLDRLRGDASRSGDSREADQFEVYSKEKLDEELRDMHTLGDIDFDCDDPLTQDEIEVSPFRQGRYEVIRDGENSWATVEGLTADEAIAIHNKLVMLSEAYRFHALWIFSQTSDRSPEGKTNGKKEHNWRN